MASNTHKYVAKEGSRNFFCRRAPHGARGLKRMIPLGDRGGDGGREGGELDELYGHIRTLGNINERMMKVNATEVRGGGSVS